MPRDKSVLHGKIVEAATREFLEKGFENASLREIALAAGMSVSGLYRHYESKEAMFAALVEPTVSELTQTYRDFEAEGYSFLESGDLSQMWEKGSGFRELVDFIYGHYTAFQLLICKAEGTRYADFVHDLALLEERATLAFMDAVEKKGARLNRIPEQEFHLLITSSFSAIFEVVRHDFTRRDARHYAETLRTFYTPGWRKILGF